MENTLIDFGEITVKSQKIDGACAQLKKEFIGIDRQIDQVVNAFRSWYLFPLLQERPVVVNLYGMTGVGKTSLVKRFTQLMDLEPDFVYFNFAAIDEMNGWEVEENIEEELSNDKSNRIFVYDEFQYAATLNERGEEKEKKGSLKPFWELLDSGLLHMRGSIWRLHTITTILKYLGMIDARCPIEMQGGEWTNRDECLSYFGEYDIRKFSEVLNTNKATKPQRATEVVYESGEDVVQTARPVEIRADNKGYNGLLSESAIGEMYLNYSKVVKDTNEIDFYHKICAMDYEELYSFAYNMRRNLSKGYDLCFKDSIIFVIGNIDEAYSEAFNVNPDMSPDQFHKTTSEISIVDIKKALKNRFRNEQIARLGNTYVIYPSFSSDAFRSIISLKLNEYAESVKRNVGYNLIFDESLENKIYDESVYPTHGTRPVFSTVYEIVNTKLPKVMIYIAENKIENRVSDIRYSFDGDNFVATMSDGDGEVVGEISVKEEFRLGKLRKPTMGETQAACAVHESGHFVLYARLFGSVPDKLVSASAASGVGGFLMPTIPADGSYVDSKKMIINKIRVLLGGYVAESLCFGSNNVSSGAQRDLQQATEMAGRMARSFGMCANATKSVISTQTKDEEFCVKEYNNDNRNNDIIGIVESARRFDISVLSDADWRKMLRESSEYLSEHTNMPKEKMWHIYNNVPSDVRDKTKDVEDFYRKKIKEI